MRLIITRPEDDAKALAEKLTQLGHQAVLLPLIKIVPRTTITVPDLPWVAICFSSANAPRAVPATDKLKLLPVYTVGPQSKAEAENQGYSNVEAHGGDVNGLSQYLAIHLKPDAGPILYLSGAETSGDLEGKLRQEGFKVHREIVYDALPAVPPNLVAELATAEGVLLYSPRTSLHWISAIQRSGSQAAALRLRHFCLSASVAAKLPPNLDIVIAATPDEAGMLALLG
jgi:uroporphyrinogen-III synthase